MSSCHDCDDCFVCVLSVIVASLYQSCLLPVPGVSRRLDNALSFGATRWARTLQLRWKMASAMILSLNVFLCKMLQWKVEDVFRLRNIPSLECLNIRKGRVCFCFLLRLRFQTMQNCIGDNPNLELLDCFMFQMLGCWASHISTGGWFAKCICAW